MKLVGQFGFVFMFVIVLMGAAFVVGNLSGGNPAVFGPPVASLGG